MTLDNNRHRFERTGNASKKIKHPHRTKKNEILCHRTLHTFAFACNRTSQPKGKVKRVQSPTLYSVPIKFSSLDNLR